MNESQTCPSCGVETPLEDEFCSSCGEPLAAVEGPPPRPGRRRPARSTTRASGRFAARSRQKKVANAATWILVLSILFAVFGTLFGFMAKSTANEAHANLARFDDAEVLEIEGDTMTVAEWKKAVDQEVLLIFVSNYVLALVMLGIYFWAKKDPLPAIVTAFSIFLVVQIIGVVVDPTTLVKGIIIKVLVIVVFIGGIKAALEQRAAGEEPVPARGRRRRR